MRDFLDVLGVFVAYAFVLFCYLLGGLRDGVKYLFRSGWWVVVVILISIAWASTQSVEVEEKVEIEIEIGTETPLFRKGFVSYLGVSFPVEAVIFPSKKTMYVITFDPRNPLVVISITVSVSGGETVAIWTHPKMEQINLKLFGVPYET